MVHADANRTVVVCGAGIAGLTTAYWLRQWGVEPVVLEVAAGPRPGGQAIDVRGPALDVVDRMGTGDALRQARTSMHGMSVVDPDGNEVFRDTSITLTGGPLDGEDVEILRDDLIAVLQAAIDAGPYIETRYGVTIQRLHDDAAGVDVELSDGSHITAVAVIGADGLHSGTRELAFDEGDIQFRDLGSHLSVFTAPNDFGLESWQVFSRVGDTMAGIYTARENSEVRVNLGFTGAAQYDYRDLDAQRRAIVAAFDGQGWWIPRLLQAMNTATDFYLAPMIQVIMDRWSAGRIGLVGDAAWCTTPMSGQGTSLALVGGYVLAGELARQLAGDDPDVPAAWAGYEELMRPFVEMNQQLAIINEQRSQEMFFDADDSGGTPAAAPNVGERAAEGMAEHWAATAATAIDLPDYAEVLALARTRLR